MEDVRRVRPHVRAVERRPRPRLLDELDELRLGVLPREVGVRLREADLGERRHRRRARERLGEEDRLGMHGADLGDQPLPERHRLRVRVVDAEDEDAARAPAEDDVAQRIPELLALGRVPVDVVDVLVALRRVLGVLERAVGAAVEPLRVLAQPRVVGRALDREVERELDAGGRARRPPSRRSRRRCRDRDGARRGRRPRRRSPTGCPESPLRARSALLRPLRCVSPIGCTGGR